MKYSISYVDSSALNNRNFSISFRKLKRLNLGGNELTSVPQRALSIFDTLKKLEIQENKIRVIKEGDFEGKCISNSSCLNQTSVLLEKYVIFQV